MAKQANDADLGFEAKLWATSATSNGNAGAARHGPGGDFYNNQNARVGKLFATHVMGAAMGGEIGFREAYALTGLRGGTFQHYAGRLGIPFS